MKWLATAVLDNRFLIKELANQMRVTDFPRLVGLIMASSLSLIACHKQSAGGHSNQNVPVELVLPEKGAYTGAYIDFGDAEEDVTLETIEEFEAMTGKHQAIIASSSYWGEQDFPTNSLNVIWRHKSVPLVF